jgi:hypothetical protein
LRKVVVAVEAADPALRRRRHRLRLPRPVARTSRQALRCNCRPRRSHTLHAFRCTVCMLQAAASHTTRFRNS